MPTDAGAAKVAVPEVLSSDTQLAPEIIFNDAVKLKVPPPALRTASCRLVDGLPWTAFRLNRGGEICNCGLAGSATLRVTCTTALVEGEVASAMTTCPVKLPAPRPAVLM